MGVGAESAERKRIYNLNLEKSGSNTNSSLFSHLLVHLSLGSAKQIHGSSSSATNVKISQTKIVLGYNIPWLLTKVLIVLISWEQKWKEDCKILVNHWPTRWQNFNIISLTHFMCRGGKLRLWDGKQLSFKDTPKLRAE